MAFKILSCDGGGIRGLITSLLIEDLDKKFQLIEKSDGFAGTSTGGLIALALANGNKIEDIIDIYENQGKIIFNENDINIVLEDIGAVFPHLTHNILKPFDFETGPGLFYSQYKSNGLRKIATELLQDKTLGNIQKFVVVNSAQLLDAENNSWEPKAFSNTNHDYQDIEMVDIALATSAAPTYFPPHQIESLGYFADGGTFANNPSVTAITEAIASGYIKNIEDLRILSLGTGDVPGGISAKDIGDPLKWGVFKWLDPLESHSVPKMPLLNLVLDLTGKLPTFQAKQILGQYYRRGNFDLTFNIPLDAWQHVENLRKETEGYIKSKAWQEVCKWVEKNWL